MTANHATAHHVSTGLTGYVLCEVLNHKGECVRRLPPVRNLWLDQGLDRLATVVIADAFAVCVKGTGQSATKEIPHTSNTYTLAGTTLTRNASPGTPRDFVPGDIGKLVRSSDGKECMILAYSSAVQVGVTTVGLNPLVPFAAKTIQFYHIGLTGLTQEAFSDPRTETVTKVGASFNLDASAAVFNAAHVGLAVLIVPTSGDPVAERYTVASYVSPTQITLDRNSGAFTDRHFVIYTPQDGDTFLTPLSRTSVTSVVSGENSTVDTIAAGFPTGKRTLKRTFIFDPEPSVIEIPAGTATWTGTGVTATGSRDFTPLDVDKYLKFAGGEFCKIVSRTSTTVLVVDRAPSAPITASAFKIYGGNSYDGIGFSDSDDPTGNLNILVRLENNSGVVTPVLVAGENPELPGQQLKVTYICEVNLFPNVVTARAAAAITDSDHKMSVNKFGTSVVEGVAVSSIDSAGHTVSEFNVLEPSVPGYVALSNVFSPTIKAFSGIDRSPGAVPKPMLAEGYTLGDFSQLYSGRFLINDAIASNWRIVGIYDLESNAFAFVWLFEANQIKTGDTIISFRFRKSWNRDLS